MTATTATLRINRPNVMKTRLAQAVMLLSQLCRGIIWAPFAVTIGAAMLMQIGASRALQWLSLHAMYNGAKIAQQPDIWRRS